MQLSHRRAFDDLLCHFGLSGFTQFRVFDWLFGNLDDEVRLQLLVLATAFFIFGIVILLACIFTLAIKRALLKAEAFQTELDKLLLPKIFKI